MFLHAPVLLKEAVSALILRPDGVYVDATFGRGGHSAAILNAISPEGRLLAMDRDPEAVACARGWVDPRFCVEKSRFSELLSVLARRGIAKVDGVLLDLGVSSAQLETPSRGFSFRLNGPLDMRMDPCQGISAREWLFSATEGEITGVLRDYGEERFAGWIAKAIVARRGAFSGDTFRTTRQLSALVSSVLGRKRSSLGKDPATRTFQAIRILVNQELEELEIVLDAAVTALRPGGRLVVLSFHSLEDRLVKRFMSRVSGRDLPRDWFTGALQKGDFLPQLELLGRFFSSEAEIARNPRARSVVMRVAQRTDG